MLTELHTQQHNTKTQVNVISQRHQWLKNKAKLHQQLTEQRQQLTAKQTQLKDFAKHGKIFKLFDKVLLSCVDLLTFFYPYFGSAQPADFVGFVLPIAVVVADVCWLLVFGVGQ